MARQLIGWVHKEKVLLADRGGDCNWILIRLLQLKGVEVVVRLHQARPTGIGRVFWPKPQRQGRWAKCLWNELPESLTLRVVRFRVDVPGFRTKHIAVATTFLDEARYPDSAIEELYQRRGRIELNFRDIKTALGLDALLSRSPAMIEKKSTCKLSLTIWSDFSCLRRLDRTTYRRTGSPAKGPCAHSLRCLRLRPIRI